MKDMSVTVSDDLKGVLSQCKPGQTKEISVMVAMDKSGKVTLSSSDGEYGEASPDEVEAAPVAPVAKATPTEARRPKPVMDAINAMYA